MIVRLKELWMIRTAIERLMHSKVPLATAIAMQEMVDVLNDEMTDYTNFRKQVWAKLGLPVPKWKFWISRKKLVEQFNKEVADEAEREVELPTPIPSEVLAPLSLSTVDLLALKARGIVG